MKRNKPKKQPTTAASTPMSTGQGQSAVMNAYMPIMPEPSNRVLRIAIIASIVFHLILLSIKFADPKAIENLFKKTSLDIVLLNMRTDEAPTEAKVIAQYNHAGGGDSADDIYASSPIEYSATAVEGDSFEESTLAIEAIRRESVRLLSSAQQSYANLPPVEASWGENDPRRIAAEEHRKELSDQIAALEQRVEEENSRPRRLRIGPTAREDSKVIFFDAIRNQIILKAEESFPRYKGRSLYGILEVDIAVTAEGKLIHAITTISSGNQVLDNQTLAIISAAGVFPPAPAELLRAEPNVDFAFTMRLTFKGDGTVQTDLME